MSLNKKFVFAAAMLAALTSFGNSWTINKKFDPRTWSPSANNFLLKQVPTLSDDFVKYTEKVSGGKEEWLTDGKMSVAIDKDDPGGTDYSNTFGITSGALEWTFEEPVAEFLQLIIYSHWGNSGRDGLTISSIEVTTDGSNWTTLQNSYVSGGEDWDSDYGRHCYTLSNGGDPLATNIVGLRINFPNGEPKGGRQENGGAGCTEIEAIGTAKEVPMVNASVAYVAPKKAGLTATVLGCGEGYDQVDVYFAYGTAQGSLCTPYCVATGKKKNDTCPFVVRDLEKETTYYYSCTVRNAGGDVSDPAEGTFTTTDGSVLTWLGAEDSDWSNGMNWDTEEAPSAGSTLAKIILSADSGNHAPTNLDIEGLQINDLNYGSDCRMSFAISGEPLTVGQISSVDGSSGTMVFSNEVTFTGRIVMQLNGSKVQLAGPVHATAEDNVIYQSSNWRTDLSLMNAANDFEGAIKLTSGTLNFYSDGSLGAVPSAAPSAPNVDNSTTGNGNVNAVAFDQNHINSIWLDPYRWLHGKITINGGVDLVYNGPIDDGTWFTSPQWSSWRYLTLGGSAQGSSEAAFSTNAMIVVDRVYRTTIGAQAVVDQPSRGIQAGTDAMVDLNGFDPVCPLATDGKGGRDAADIPKFINGNSADESVISGELRLGGVSFEDGGVVFGGLGDIRLEGNVQENPAVPGARPFRKQGPGKLTIASASTAWQGDTAFVGDVTLDYQASNTPKLGGKTSATFGDGTLEVIANASGTTCELTGLTLNYGLTKFVTSGNVSWTLSSLKMPLQTINSQQIPPAADFSVGSGFQLTDTDYHNIAEFGGLGPHFTVNNGAAWAALDADGATIVPMTAGSAVTDLPAGTTSKSGEAGAIRAAAAGDMALTIDGSLTLSAFGNENAAGILYSPAAGGDLTINGGILAAADGAKSLTIQNWNTEHELAIYSKIANADGSAAEFDLTLIGPGTTILASGDNTFRGGPNVFGGGTVKFTSVKCFNGDNGTQGYSALGRAGYGNGDIYCGDGATYEYIGTDSEGHVSDRTFFVSGEVTFKANGVGPLTIKHPGLTRPLIKTCRVILDGDADKGGGVLSNENGWGYGEALNPGDCGEVVKRGTGTWTVHSVDGVYGMRTTVEAGVLELAAGASVRAPVVVKSGGTLRIEPGTRTYSSKNPDKEGKYTTNTGTTTLRRDLTVEKGGTLDIVCNDEGPAVVWGRVSLAGNLTVSGKKLREDTVVLVSESGLDIDGTATPPPGCRLIKDGNKLIFRPSRGFTVIVR